MNDTIIYGFAAHIMAHWDEWEAEAESNAQVMQNSAIVSAVMHEKLEAVLRDLVLEAAGCCDRRASVIDRPPSIRCEANKCAAQIRHTLLCREGEHVCYRCDGVGCEVCLHRGIKGEPT